MEVFPAAEALEVFANNSGVTLKQFSPDHQDDVYIVIPLAYIERVVGAIRFAGVEASEGGLEVE